MKLWKLLLILVLLLALAEMALRERMKEKS